MGQRGMLSATEGQLVSPKACGIIHAMMRLVSTRHSAQTSLTPINRYCSASGISFLAHLA